MGCAPGKPVADIGAGTGKLTKELLKQGLTVKSVEPNAAMRAIGIQNTKGQSVTWSVGTGEETGLPTCSVYSAFFGSSFNVVNQSRALVEVTRILVPNGWFACMWNHRDLNAVSYTHLDVYKRQSLALTMPRPVRLSTCSISRAAGQARPAPCSLIRIAGNRRARDASNVRRHVPRSASANTDKL